MCLANVRHTGKKLAVMLLNVDRFKTVNASLGHQLGDEVLKQFGRRLQEFTPEGGSVARMGGDNFLCLVSNLDNSEDAVKCADQILAVLSRPFSIEGRELHISAGIGVVTYPNDGSTPEALLKHARYRHVQGKSRGRQRVLFVY